MSFEIPPQNLDDGSDTSFNERPNTIESIDAKIALLEPELHRLQSELIQMQEAGLPQNKEVSPEEKNIRLQIKMLDQDIQKLKGDKDYLLQEETSFIKKPQ